jgi:hypothetical protein
LTDLYNDPVDMASLNFSSNIDYGAGIPFGLRIKCDDSHFFGKAGPILGVGVPGEDGLIIESHQNRSYWKFKVFDCSDAVFDPNNQIPNNSTSNTRPYEVSAGYIISSSLPPGDLGELLNMVGTQTHTNDSRILGLFPTEDFTDLGGGDANPTNTNYHAGIENPYRGGWFTPDINMELFDFTGQHKSSPVDPTLLNIENIGLIVKSTGSYKNFPEDRHLNKPNINQAVPVVALADEPKLKSVFGVIANSEDPENGRVLQTGMLNSFCPKTDGDERVIVNSLGEGGMWVCDVDGPLENGDYVTTCSIPGYGTKQDDDLLHNYTVAKITQDCDFDLESELYHCDEQEHNGVTYKRAFVGVTYHCG